MRGHAIPLSVSIVVHRVELLIGTIEVPTLVRVNQMESGKGKQRRQDDIASQNTPEGQERMAKAQRQMFDWMDKGDPQAMGYGSEFFKLLQDRRAARGLPPL